jgi:hypothetical protein
LCPRLTLDNQLASQVVAGLRLRHGRTSKRARLDSGRGGDTFYRNFVKVGADHILVSIARRDDMRRSADDLLKNHTVRLLQRKSHPNTSNQAMSLVPQLIPVAQSEVMA